MTDYCVVVTGGARARFFTLEPVEYPELESGPRLIECRELCNPQKEMPRRDIYAEPKTGRHRAPHGGPTHGYDDHRSQHEDEFDRRFAHEVMVEARRFVHANQARCLALVAPPHILGMIRSDLQNIAKRGMVVQKLSKDMSKFSSRQIHEHLARQQVLPPCKRPGV
jgi:protein required for attachment to host cells